MVTFEFAILDFHDYQGFRGRGSVCARCEVNVGKNEISAALVTTDAATHHCSADTFCYDCASIVWNEVKHEFKGYVIVPGGKAVLASSTEFEDLKPGTEVDSTDVPRTAALVRVMNEQQSLYKLSTPVESGLLGDDDPEMIDHVFVSNGCYSAVETYAFPWIGGVDGRWAKGNELDMSRRGYRNHARMFAEAGILLIPNPDAPVVPFKNKRK